MTSIGHVDGDWLAATRGRAALGVSPMQDEFARKLQERSGGRWLCWYASSTGSYWAVRKPAVPFGLVEGKTPEELAINMGEVDAFYGGRS